MLTLTQLRYLMSFSDDTAVSVYMPIVPHGTDKQQNPIRLKNLLSQAEHMLKEAGLRTPTIDTLMQPARDLLDDTFFWQYQHTG